mmetsp:Transcript_4609/g.11386  ORF Transcript_4609/g.11386 Transcript_4609/m.11386 type:complete len:106 (+) Transcript_4609:57-374(+)
MMIIQSAPAGTAQGNSQAYCGDRPPLAQRCSDWPSAAASGPHTSIAAAALPAASVVLPAAARCRRRRKRATAACGAGVLQDAGWGMLLSRSSAHKVSFKGGPKTL